MDKAVAVIDIGMTNKKVALYDGDLGMLDSAHRSFEPISAGSEGIPAHDLAGMEEWFLDTLAAFARKREIGAVAVTTHGATMVLVGKDGRPCAPCLYYTHEPGPAFHERFYAMAGRRESLQAVTGTPDLSAMINPAKGLLFLKENFPEDFARAELVLSYPQYWGWRLTGKAGAEGTYAGCHTYLWDWERERYSSVAEALGVAAKMPSPLRRSWDPLGRIKPEVAARTGLPADTVVTMGIHDSNASLLPHIAKKGGGDFVLNSTGTWCVLMHPRERFGFEPGELGKVVFFNRSALMRPVKTAIFLGGMEYETWSRAIETASGHKPEDPGAAAYPGLLAAADCFILPELVPGSGQFPGSRSRAVEGGREYALDDIKAGRAAPAFMRDARKAMAALDASLAIQTRVALGRTGLGSGTEVFTEGGFRRNADYNALLATALPRNRAYLTDIAEATSLGAAMTAAAALRDAEGRGSAAATADGGRAMLEEIARAFEIDYRPVEPMPGASSFEGYARAWLERVGGA